MWVCPSCSATVDVDFAVCWQCGTDREGVEDPGFLHADETPPIANSPDFVGQEPMGAAKAFGSSNPFGDLDEGQPLDLVECYWAANGQEAHFLAEELVAAGIPAIADDDMLRQGVGAAAFGAPYFQPRVRVRSGDLDRARRWLEAYEEDRRTRHHGGESFL